MPLRAIPSKKTTSDAIQNGAVVEYEQHGKQILAVVLGEKKSKFHLFNQEGQELELSSDRLFLLPQKLDAVDKKAALQELAAKVEQRTNEIDLEGVWSLFQEQRRELAPQELAELSFSTISNESIAAARRALVRDQIYFKRLKTTFEPRSDAVVEELKKKAEVENQRRREREQLIASLRRRIAGESVELGPMVRLLEDFAAGISHADRVKEAQEIVEECQKFVSLEGKGHERAFDLLVKAHWFDIDEDLELIREGRRKDFSASVIKEVGELLGRQWRDEQREDLSSLYIVTIDAETTRDIDDGLSVEVLDDGYRLGIHISDVAGIIDRGTRLDDEALIRGTSIYCPDYQVSMLPVEISEGLISLIAEQRRGAMSFFIEFDKSFNIRAREIKLSLIRVARRVSYDEADKILFGELSDPALSPLLQLLWNIACKLEERRVQQGAIQFSRRELNAIIDDQKRIRLEETDEELPGRKLVGELMIAANETAALFAKDNGVPLIFRGQEEPEQNPANVGLHVPEGPAREYLKRGVMKRSLTSPRPAPHYGLGLAAYVQATSPIRRASDLINQRQLEQFILGRVVTYPEENLSELIQTIEARTDVAFYIQRQRNRYWLQKYLLQEGITEIFGTIVKVDGPKPLAELEIIYSLSPFFPLKGRENPRKPGERVRLRIEENNPRKESFILKEIE